MPGVVYFYDKCRVHADSWINEPTSHWDPSMCSFCLKELKLFKDDHNITKAGALLASQKVFKEWIFGFAKLAHKKGKKLPYISCEYYRNLIFPYTSKDVVVNPDPIP